MGSSISKPRCKEEEPYRRAALFVSIRINEYRYRLLAPKCAVKQRLSEVIIATFVGLLIAEGMFAIVGLYLFLSWAKAMPHSR